MEETIIDQFPEGAVGDHQLNERCWGMPGEKNRLSKCTVAWCNIPHLENHR